MVRRREEKAIRMLTRLNDEGPLPAQQVRPMLRATPILPPSQPFAHDSPGPRQTLLASPPTPRVQDTHALYCLQVEPVAVQVKVVACAEKAASAGHFTDRHTRCRGTHGDRIPFNRVARSAVTTTWGTAMPIPSVAPAH